MPDLAHSLNHLDLGLLHNIAELWGIDLEAPDVRRGRANLAAALLSSRELLAEIVESLPPQAQTALAELQHNQGRMLWPQFSRRYGDIREMGRAKRERQNPHRSPASTAELLWYRALISLAFFDSEHGPQEYAYIPDDLLARLPDNPSPENNIRTRPAAPAERKHILPASSRILDQACTYLAGLRAGLDLEEISRHFPGDAVPLNTLQALLSAAGFIDQKLSLDLAAVRGFLEAGRGEALLTLFTTWRDSPMINDLRLLPHLQAEGEWQNDPQKARRFLLRQITPLDPQTWWGLPALVTAIRQSAPDFQRPAGNYDSWYLRDTRTGAYLRGIEHWEAVDGELLRYLVYGPLHWLGILDLASPAAGQALSAFRFSALAAALLANTPPELKPEDQQLTADSKLTIQIPPGFPRAVRYQLARFCAWESIKKDRFNYRITPASLAKAEAHDLNITQLLTLLRKHCAIQLPPNLVQSLENWQAHGTQARIEDVQVLRLKSPELLKALRASHAARYLGDPLGPTSVIVKRGAWQKVIDALAEMGYLSAYEPSKERDQ